MVSEGATTAVTVELLNCSCLQRVAVSTVKRARVEATAKRGQHEAVAVERANIASEQARVLEERASLANEQKRLAQEQESHNEERASVKRAMAANARGVAWLRKQRDLQEHLRKALEQLLLTVSAQKVDLERREQVCTSEATDEDEGVAHKHTLGLCTTKAHRELYRNQAEIDIVLDLIDNAEETLKKGVFIFSYELVRSAYFRVF